MDPSVSPDVFVPITAIQIAAATTDPLRNNGLWNPCRVVGRLAAGVGDEEARIDVERLVRDAIETARPSEPYEPPRVWLVDAGQGLSTLRDATSAPLAVMFSVVGGLLLAACANIAGLLLARGNARQKEIATRLALGASRARVIRQLMTESVVLSLVGGILGLGLAYALSMSGRTLLSQFMPTLFSADRPIDIASSPDLRVLGFGLATAILSGLLFGMLPAFQATRFDLMAIIRQAAPSGVHRFSVSGGQLMVLAQTALAVLLLVGAGAFLRTVVNLQSVDLGFHEENLLYARVEPRSGALPNDRRGQFFEEAVRRLQVLPGANAVAGASLPPMAGNQSVGVSAGVPVCSEEQLSKGLLPTAVATNFVTPGYFEALGVGLVSGSDFTWIDNQARQPPAIVNEAYVRALLSGRDPMGQGVTFGFDCRKPFGQVAIVGVVRDSRVGARAAAGPTVYRPLGAYGGPVTLIVKTSGEPQRLIGSVRRAITDLNANIPTFGETTVHELRERSLRQEHLLSNLLVVFAGVTVLVCCLGIYGLLSYAVARRRGEISVRMALGARSRDIVAMVVRESLLPVAGGILIGWGLALATTTWVEGFLFGISGHDPWLLGSAALLFLTIAAIAAAVPARVASRVDPVLALRQ